MVNFIFKKVCLHTCSLCKIPDVKKNKVQFCKSLFGAQQRICFQMSKLQSFRRDRNVCIKVFSNFGAKYVNSDVKCVSGRGLIIRRLSVQKVFYFKIKK